MKFCENKCLQTAIKLVCHVDFRGRGEYNYVRCPGSKIMLGSYHVTPTFPIPGGDTQARLVK